MIKDYNWGGIGVGNYINVSKHYNNPWNTSKVHNQYLYWLVEYGLSGFIFFCWFIFSFLRIGHQATKVSKESDLFPIALGINSAIIGLMVVNNSGLAMSHIPIFLLFCVLLGINSSIIRLKI
jgi:O-antigen ligase